MGRRYLILLIIIGLFTLSFGQVAFGTEDYQEKTDETRAEISELEAAVKALEADINKRQARLEEIATELALSEKQLLEAEAELAVCEANLEEKLHVFGGRLRSVYISGSFSYLDNLLKAESFGDLLVRLFYLKKIFQRDAGLLEGVKQEQASLLEQQAIISEHNESLQSLKYEAESEYQNLLDKLKSKEVLLAEAKGKLADQLDQIFPQSERKPMYGVVIDNIQQARPQAGLARASVVYEYEVEGKITRYLALFAEFPTKVGPIRSGRVQNTTLALENDVHFIFASGGADILDIVDSWGLKYTNALYSSSKSLYRDPARRAPHNLYINLATFGKEKPSSELIVKPVKLSKQGATGASVSLEYNSTTRIKYQYISELGGYRRYLNGKVCKDASGQEIIVRNLIIQYAPHKKDEKGRPMADLIGKGVIDFYCQGQYFRGSWQKSSPASPTRFYYQDGQEIERISGQTWIQIVRAR